MRRSTFGFLFFALFLFLQSIAETSSTAKQQFNGDGPDSKNTNSGKIESDKNIIKVGQSAITLGSRIIVRDTPSLKNWKTLGHLDKGQIVKVKKIAAIPALLDGGKYKWIYIEVPGLEGWCTDRLFKSVEEIAQEVTQQNKPENLSRFLHTEAFIESNYLDYLKSDGDEKILECRNEFVKNLLEVNDIPNFIALGCPLEIKKDDVYFDDKCKDAEKINGTSLVNSPKKFASIVSAAECSQLQLKEGEDFFILKNEPEKIDINESSVSFKFRWDWGRLTGPRGILDIQIPGNGLLYKSKGKPKIKKLKVKSEKITPLKKTLFFNKNTSSKLQSISLTQEIVPADFNCDTDRQSDDTKVNNISIIAFFKGEDPVQIIDLNEVSQYTKLEFSKDFWFDESESIVYFLIEKHDEAGFYNLLFSFNTKTLKVDSQTFLIKYKECQGEGC